MPPATDPSPLPLRAFAAILSALLAVAVLGALTPGVPLDSWPADLVVRITDTASWGQMPWLSTAVLAMIVSRPGISGRRRWAEGVSLALVMTLVLAGNGVLNEDVVKPLFAVPRPNIEAWAESGRLGADIADAEAFYESGTKDERRVILDEQLPEASALGVTDLVRAHWVHEAGYSFPSGHSTTAVAFATVLVGLGLTGLAGWRRVVAIVIVPVWAGAVVLTRIVLEVHTTIDAVAGTVAGMVWGTAAYLAIRWLVTRLAPQISQSSV